MKISYHLCTLLVMVFSFVILSSANFAYAGDYPVISISPDQPIMYEPTYISCNVDVGGQVFVILKDIESNFDRQLLSPTEVVLYNNHNYDAVCMWYVDEIEHYSEERIEFYVQGEEKAIIPHSAITHGVLSNETLTINPASPTINDDIIIECDFPEEYGTSIQYGNEVDYHLEEFEIRIFKDNKLVWTVYNAYPDADTGKYGSTRPALIDPDTMESGGIGEYRAYCGYSVVADGYWINNGDFYEYKYGNRSFEDDKYFTVIESTTDSTDDSQSEANKLFIDYRVEEINDKLFDTQEKLDSYLMRKANINSFTTQTDSKVQFYLDKIEKLETIKENLLRVN